MSGTAYLPLAGIRVIDTTVERGELCARLLADLGANVIKVEPPGGASSRSLPPLAPDGTSLYFAVRNTNKRSAVVDLLTNEGRNEFERLLGGADIWVTSTAPEAEDRVGLGPGELGVEQVQLRQPHLVITSVTDFGRTGPYRDFVGTDDVLIAMGGMLARSGVVGRPPLLTPGSLAYDSSSIMAAFLTLAALWQRNETGQGQILDVSVMQAVSQLSDWSLTNGSFIKAAGGMQDNVRNGSGPVYPLYPCADGYVRLIILSPRQWRAMRAWLGEPDVLQDSALDGLVGRMAIQQTVLYPLFVELFKNGTSAELSDEAQRRGIVMTPVLKPDQVPTLPHFVQRGTFVHAQAAPGVRGALVAGFYEFNGERVGYRTPSPAPGEHTADIAAESIGARHTATQPARAKPPSALPFANLKVLDMGHGGVGVEVGKLFAEYGANVIKVETRTYPDFIRMVSGGLMSPSFASSSRCKRSLGLNAKTPEGLALLKQLVEWADVFIENTSTGTMADMGIPFMVLHEINPRLVMISSQLMGSRGPWKDWIGYGPSTRAAGGMTHLWNFEDGGMPPGSGAIHPDHLVGRLGALGALASLIGRDAGLGQGVHVELAQLETVVNLLGDLFLQESLSPGSVVPEGNRSPRGAPWGVYQCQGPERWCVITVRDDTDWHNLKVALGNPEWAINPDFASALGRHAAADHIDAQLSLWTGERSDYEVMQTLQAAGVPAGIMAYASDHTDNEHCVARRYPQPVTQPPLGELLFEGPAMHATGMPDPWVGPAPLLAQHTREICHEIFGLGDAEIDELITKGALEESLG